MLHLTPTRWSVAAIALLAFASGASAVQIEVTSVVAPGGGGPTTFNFTKPFTTVPLVFSLPTDQGGDPATVKIFNVTTTSFDITVAEPPGEDGPHAAMNVPILAITEGSGTIGGLQFEAGRISTTQVVSSGGGNADVSDFDSVFFASPFITSPAVLAEIQTANNETGTPPTTPSDPWLTVSIDSAGGGPSGSNIAPTGFRVALDKAETGTGDVAVAEDIAYLALEQGVGNFFTDDGNAINFLSFISPNTITGWTNGSGSVNVPYPADLGLNAVVLASLATRDGGDGGWLRSRGVTGTSIKHTTDEEQTNDTERGHTDEAASIIGFSGTFAGNIIPEPATASLLLLGAAGILRRRGRTA